MAPGQSHEFDIQLTAPSQPGTYTTIWRMAHGKSVCSRCSFVADALGDLAGFGPLAQVSVQVVGAHGTTTPTPTPVPPGQPTPTPTVGVGPTATPTPVHVPTWHAILQQYAPSCSNPGGVSWNWIQAGGGNVISCTSSGLLMQQGQTHFPEADLTSVNGSFDANTLIVKVHVHFTQANSTTYYNGTDASIVVQTPPQANVCGGLLFEIRPNGEWRLQQTHGDCSQSVLTSGTVGAATDYNLMVRVQNGVLYGSFNGSQVLSWGDSLSGGVTGLLVIDFGWPSGQVYYTNFELDQFS